MSRKWSLNFLTYVGLYVDTSAKTISKVYSSKYILLTETCFSVSKHSIGTLYNTYSYFEVSTGAKLEEKTNGQRCDSSGMISNATHKAGVESLVIYLELHGENKHVPLAIARSTHAFTKSV